MNAVRRTAVVAAAVAMVLATGDCGRVDNNAPAVARQVVLRQFAALDTALAMLAAPADPAGRRAALQLARTRFKQAELSLEYFAPLTARRMNGAPLDRFEDDAPTVTLAAEGFQVAELVVYTGSLPANAAAQMATIATRMRGHLRRAVQVFSSGNPTEAQFWDALRLEAVRLSTMGLGSFDTAVSGRAALETADALDGMRAVLSAWLPGDRAAHEVARLDTVLLAAMSAAAAGARAELWDRLEFLRLHLIPVSHAIVAARVALGVPTVASRSLLRADAASPFDSGAFDASALRQSDVPRPTPEQVAFGSLLFSSPILSGSGSRSCESCHQISRALTDGQARATPLPGSRATLRATPSLINVALQGAQFADGRVTYLEDQVTAVVGSVDELHGSLDLAARRVSGDSALHRAFAVAYPGATPTGRHLQQAIAAFLRTIIFLDAPFDRYLRGDTSAMAPNARRGFTLFQDKAKCGTCHFAPLFNGTVPPGYTDTEYEVIGVPVGPGGTRVDNDPGRGTISRSPLQQFAFKTPTVRNAAVTAPYMHNGAMATLDDVIEFYRRGGSGGPGQRLKHLTLPFDSLALDTWDRADLKAFILALTDTVGMHTLFTRRSATR